MTSLLRNAVGLALATGLLVACAGPDGQDVLRSTSSSSSSASDSDGGGSSDDSPGSSGDGNCTSETEPNNAQARANAISGSMCGSISPTGDTDWLTFTLKPSTKTLSLEFSGRVRLRVSVEGHGTTELTPDNAGQVPFVQGKPYYVQVAAFSDSSAALPWTVTVVER